MSFVNNSEFIWEFLGNERDWQELGAFDSVKGNDMIFQLLQKDQLEIEKMKLKKDAEILNKMIIIQEDGSVVSNKQYIPSLKKKCGYESPDINSSDEDDLSERCSELIVTPERLRK